MDVDSTLIMEEGIDLLGEEAGVELRLRLPSVPCEELTLAALREKVAL